jgi:hypothetical protein
MIKFQGLGRAEGLGKFKKKKIISSDIEPATFQFVVNHYAKACQSIKVYSVRLIR